jgi:archaeosortase C (PEF-CTERM variant)
MSLIFLVLFSAVYVLPGMLGVKLPYYYGHYFITLPVASVLRAAGLNLEVVSMNLLNVGGKTNSLIGLDMACYGFYSMFLIISATTAYGITMKLQLRRLLPVLLILAAASYAANFLRVSTLITLAYYYGTETMLLVHSHLGWLFFGFILLPLMYLFLK